MGISQSVIGVVPDRYTPFSQKFSTDGTSSGTTEMGVNGSVTPVEHYIGAVTTGDRFISHIIWILGYGSAAEGFEFADSGAALTNGVRVYFTHANGSVYTIMNPKSNYSFFRSSLAPVSSTNWEERGFAGTGDYGYFVTTPLSKIVPPYGIKLPRNSDAKLSILIRDDCTDADLFNCNAFGFTG